jgi:hypothetical protein
MAKKQSKKNIKKSKQQQQQSRAPAGKDAVVGIQLCLVGFCITNDWIFSFLLPALSAPAPPSRHRNADDNPLLLLFSTLPDAILHRIYQFAVRVIYTHDELIKAVDEYHAVPPPLPRSGRSAAAS